MTLSRTAARLVTIVGLLSGWTAGPSGPAAAGGPEGPPLHQSYQAVRPAAAGTAVLAGVVMTAESASRPLRRVTVTLNGGGLTNLLAITDDGGRFVFRGLPAGRYLLDASRPGYVNTAYGATRPNRPGTAIALADGQQITSISMKLLRGSVISGTLLTETGEPARDARVSALTYGLSPVNGERTLMSADRGVGVAVDDRGAFRLFGLAPGDYVVVATMGSRGVGVHETTDAEYQRAVQQIRAGAGGITGAGTTGTAAVSESTMGSAPVFFPGTTSVTEAQTVTLGPAEERSGVSFTLRPVPTGRIDGAIVGPDGQPVANILVTVVNGSRLPGLLGMMSMAPSRATSDRNGRFSLNGITPGTYLLVARASPAPAGRQGPAASPPAAGSSPVLWASAEVTTDGHDVSVALTMRPGVTVSGKIVFESGSRLPPPADLTRWRVGLQAVVSATGAALSVPPATVDAAGVFSFAGVTPGPYRISASMVGASSGGPGWLVKSATLGAKDIVDTPLEIATEDAPGVVVTMTDRPTELSGVLLDAAGQPAPEYFLIAFPRNAALWKPQSPRIQQARPGADGKFLFRGLLPGEYLIGAVTDVQPGEWFDRVFLQQLVGTAVSVTLAEGDKKVQNIRVK